MNHKVLVHLSLVVWLDYSSIQVFTTFFSSSGQFAIACFPFFFFAKAKNTAIAHEIQHHETIMCDSNILKGLLQTGFGYKSHRQYNSHQQIYKSD